MSGICGELSFDSTVDTSRDFERLIDMMAWRGPDGRGSWANGPCRLGFRRLSVLDNSPVAHQPIVAQDRYALVYNGEIYNLAALREELERLGASFAAPGEAEVVLQALIQWGASALERFNGAFALAFYDVEQCSLLLARDPLGVKPLYVLQTGEGLFFASQYDQVLAHPWASRLTIAPDGLGLYLRLGYVPAPYGIFRGTAMLEPGAWLEVSADGRRKRGRHYAFPVYQEPDLRGDEAVEAIDAALAAAVSRQMVSDAPMGVLLTDEVNSPLVAVKAAQTAGSLKGFSVANGDEAHEPAGETAYAQQLGLEHVVESYTPDKALQWLGRVIDACGEPLADVSLFPAMLVSNLARRDVTVALTGDGGDALFWGYVDRLAPIIEGAPEFKQPRWLRGGRNAAKRLLRSKDDPIRQGAHSVGEWRRRMDARLPDVELETLFTDFPEWAAGFDLYRYCGWQPDETAQWLRWNQVNGELARILLILDRASMFHSLETRMPFLDREVLDVAARVDWQSCLDLGEKAGKLPLRQALSRRVTLSDNPLREFAVPLAEWLRGPLLSVFYDSVMSRMEILGLPLSRAKLNELLKEHITGRADHSQWLWTLLVLSLWTDKYLER